MSVIGPSLIEAARRVLRRGGVAAVTFDSVAAEASVAPEDVEAAFDGRGNLLHELNLFCMANTMERITAAVAPSTSGEEALDAFLRVVSGATAIEMEEFRLSTHAAQNDPDMVGIRSPELGMRYMTVGNAFFDAVEAALIADWGDELLPHGVHPRRMAFVAGLMAQGLLNMRGLMLAAGSTLVHSADDVVDTMSKVMCAPPRMIRQLTALNEASRELASMRSEQALLDRLPQIVTEAFEFDDCELVLDDAEAGRVTEDRTIFDAEADLPTLITPLRCDGVPVGALVCRTHRRWRPMDAQDISRVEALAATAGVALQNVRLLENLNAMVDERTRELRDAQAALVQSEKMASMGQLVAGLAHELNTPVGAVASAQDALRKATRKLEGLMPDDADGRARATMKVISESAKVVESGGQRIDAIVSRLRSFARLDQASLQSIDVNTCVEDAIALIAHRVAPAVKLEQNLGDLVAVRCYPRKLNQLFTNLLANAFDAVGTRGVVSVTTRGVEEGIEIEIRDDGVGIPTETLERVFDPGFTTKGVGVGAGLGLSIAYGVAEEHGGSIRIDSEEGEGTRVVVHLRGA